MVTQEAIDPGEFRKALGSFTTGVTVVTTRGEDGSDIGLTANSFNSVSLEPPMVLWSLGKSSFSLSHFKAAAYFAVHILSQDQEPLSTRFARRGVDKFSGVDLARGPDDIPVLKHCAAHFICKTTYQYEGGDHIIFVGEVIDFTHLERLPLLFHGGQYGQIQKNPQLSEDTQYSEFREGSLAYLLRLSSHQILRPLKLELATRDLTLSQYHLLALIAKYNHCSLDQLMSMLAVGDTVPTTGERADLFARELIEERDGEIHLTHEGAKLHVELASIYKSSESAALRELDYDLRQTLNIALLKLVESTKSES